MHSFVVFQSLWAMERRHSDGFEPSLEASVQQIADAGFDGVSAHWTSRDDVRRLARLLPGARLDAEGVCFPKTVDDLKPVLELAAEFPIHHLNIQPDVRPRTVAECVPLLEGWLRLGEEAKIPVYIETHRDRMTNDLFFTLDLLERLPHLPLLADLSHFLVGREFPYPVTEDNQALMRRIVDSSWAFHGRVASREQVQIEIAFPHHKIWLDLFLDWWDYGFRSWRRRAAKNASLAFTCELGPKPYAITGRDGNDTTDRWAEALQMKRPVEELWAASAP